MRRLLAVAAAALLLPLAFPAQAQAQTFTPSCHSSGVIYRMIMELPALPDVQVANVLLRWDVCWNSNGNFTESHYVTSVARTAWADAEGLRFSDTKAYRVDSSATESHWFLHARVRACHGVKGAMVCGPTSEFGGGAFAYPPSQWPQVNGSPADWGHTFSCHCLDDTCKNGGFHFEGTN